MKRFVAIDLGASSGRVTVGILTSGKIEVTEVHRFAHEAQQTAENGLRWQWEHLFSQVLIGLRKAMELGEITSIGIDSWAVDYGLIDASGALLEEPYCYRDARTDGLMQEIGNSLGHEYIYSRTGIQFIFFNTAYQLFAAKKSKAYEEAAKFLLLPDLINFLLCGVIGAEITNASTTQLLNAKTHDWDWELIEKLGVNPKLFPEIHAPGKILGKINTYVDLSGIDVVSVGSHDTASAVAGIPLNSNKRSAYISSGTWSLVGLELDLAITDEVARGFNITNEVGVAGRTRFIRNITGLWLLEESIRFWKSQGETFSAKDLALAAAKLPRNQIVNSNDPRFAKPGAMPERIAALCSESGQIAPKSPAEFARCIFDSIAEGCAGALKELEMASGITVEEIKICGGGSANSLLNQLIADTTGKKVIAGPAESTILGNIIVQMQAAGEIESLAAGRELIANSVERIEYFPMNAR